MAIVLADQPKPDDPTGNTAVPAKTSSSLLDAAAQALAASDSSGPNEPQLWALWDSMTIAHLVTLTRFHQIEQIADSAPSPRAEASAVELDDICMYDGYLKVRRTASMSNTDVLISSMSLFAAVAADLVHVRLSPSSVLDIVALIERTVRRGTAQTEASEPGPGSDGLVGDLSGRLYAPQSLLGRWKYGHQLYGLANRNASALLREARDAFVLGDYQRTAKLVDDAATEVAAITATMNYAAAMTSSEYQTQVRPTMSPPYTETELTGFMNLDHRAYRAALAEFMNVCDHRWTDLTVLSPALADARERLLQRDLQDLTAHVELTYRLVGDVSALDETDDGSAVQALRSRLVNRTQTYSRWLRLGSWTHRPWIDPEMPTQNGTAT